MGWRPYHDDVQTAQTDIGTTRSDSNAFNYNSRARSGSVNSVHPDLNIKGKTRESCDTAEFPETTPIVVGMDVTKSRGNDARIIYQQVPSFLGSIKLSGIVPHPHIMWAVIGDANSDVAPLQVSQFESDRLIDVCLSNIWMEEGGGGTGEETYELLAYYLAHKTTLAANKRGKKGYAFFLGDEAPYPKASREFIKAIIGDDIEADIPTQDVFRAMLAKYHGFLIFPKSSMQARIASIDQEIKQRLKQAGGRFEKVSIRASLLWNNRNDLDIHCITPTGEHIFYGNKRGRCGGELDVDRNVHGETNKPVENIRWAAGEAPEGKYRFYVENYGFHESSRQATTFKAELDVDGELQTIEGVVPAGTTSSESRQELFSFVYKRGAEVKPEDKHANYSDSVILEKWCRYLPANILRVEDAASAVEVMLGAMALQSGKLGLDQFAANMKDRRVVRDRIDDVVAALSTFAKQGVYREVDEGLF